MKTMINGMQFMHTKSQDDGNSGYCLKSIPKSLPVRCLINLFGYGLTKKILLAVTDASAVRRSDGDQLTSARFLSSCIAEGLSIRIAYAEPFAV